MPAPGATDFMRDLAASGLANSFASACLNPCDVVKVRLQTSLNAAAQAGPGAATPMYTSLGQTARRIVTEEGVFAAWGGLYLPGMAASMLRELSYSSLRFSLYTPAKALFMGADQADPGLGAKILSGGAAGCTGSVIATPTDVVKIRFQKEAGKVVSGRYVTGLHAGEAPSYPGTLAAFRAIHASGGLRALYVGWQPTMVRAGFLAAAQLSTYDHSKYWLKREGLMGEGVGLHVVASIFAAVNTTLVTQVPYSFYSLLFFYTKVFYVYPCPTPSELSSASCAVACLYQRQPLDTVKTILMTGNFKGPVECLTSVVRANGALFLYRGATASFARFGPHFVVAMPLWEKCRSLLGLEPV